MLDDHHHRHHATATATSCVVEQYYVPYLSAIQIYTKPSSSSIIVGVGDDQQEEGQKNETVMESSCWSSDGSESSSASDDAATRSRSRSRSRSMSMSRPAATSRTPPHHFGHLYFQYHDVCSPYWRIPLSEKIMEMVETYPRLMTLKSVDLSPASWMSIAWYPIYQIPITKGYVKDLSTCFLTYHTLSSSFQDSGCHNEPKEASSKKKTAEGVAANQSIVSLPAFGLATYRMKGDVWMNPNPKDNQETSTLLFHLYSAADSWLKQLDFYHHDFHFFNMHS